MNNLSKRINFAANLTIVLILLLIGVVLINHYRHSGSSSAQNRDFRVAPGKTVSLPEVGWEDTEQTLLLVLDTKCPYCNMSASFYQQIVRETAEERQIRLIAVLPQSVDEGKQFLSDLNVQINEVRQAGLNELGVKGTPTLILVNRKGKVMRSWAGKLPAQEEKEVLIQLKEKSGIPKV